jgi:Ca2+-transporting ATPase
VYAGARAWLADDAARNEMARALTFVVLVLSNLGLIHANRSWGHTALLGQAESNQQFGWIAGGTVVVLGVVLGVPAVSQLFAFATPPPAMLLAGVFFAVLALVWFELVKRLQRRAL